MRKICGIASFGLNDSWVIDKEEGEISDYLPSAVILPGNGRKQVLISPDSKLNRCELGFPRPYDAYVKSLHPGMRRILLSMLWLQLAEDKEKHSSITQKYSGGYGTYYCSELISKFIASLYKEKIMLQGKGSHTNNDQIDLVLAIPNELDEYAQNYLLQDLSRENFETTLIWRPVAALMHMLDGASHLEENNQVTVLYIGPDCIEVTKLGVALKNHNGRSYYLPVRKRFNPAEHVSLTGIDIASSVIRYNNEFCNNNEIIEWEGLNIFSDVWKTASGVSRQSRTRDIYWEGSKWGVWYGCRRTDLSELKLDASRVLNRIYKSKRNTEKNITLINLLKNLTGDCKDGAVLVCGPMASENIAMMLADSLGKAYSGTNIQNNSVWFSIKDPIAAGAYLYQERLNKDEPTYLDELPVLKMAYRDTAEDDYAWSNLIEEAQVEGGKTYTSGDNNKFEVQSGGNSVNVYFQKESFVPGDDGVRVGLAKFSSKAREDIKLLIKVEMKAASGLAKIRFFSKDSNYLPASGYVFDYSRLAPGSLPEITHSFPHYFDYTPKNLTILDRKRIINAFTRIQTVNLENITPSLARRVFDSFLKTIASSSTKYGKTVNLDCRTSDTDIDVLIDKSIAKASECVEIFKGKKTVIKDEDSFKDFEKLCCNFCKFLNRTPEMVKEVLRKKLSRLKNSDETLFGFFLPACKALHTESDIQNLFDLFMKRTNNDCKEYHASGLVYLLLHTKTAKSHLTQEIADHMIKCGVDVMVQEIQKARSDATKKISRKFYTFVNLIMTALCYRSQESTYKYVTEDKYGNFKGEGSSVLNCIFDLLKNAREVQKNQQKGLTIDQIDGLEENIKKFFMAKGNKSFIKLVDAQADENDEE